MHLGTDQRLLVDATFSSRPTMEFLAVARDEDKRMRGDAALKKQKKNFAHFRQAAEDRLASHAGGKPVSSSNGRTNKIQQKLHMSASTPCSLAVFCPLSTGTCGRADLPTSCDVMSLGTRASAESITCLSTANCSDCPPAVEVLDDACCITPCPADCSSSIASSQQPLLADSDVQCCLQPSDSDSVNVLACHTSKCGEADFARCRDLCCSKQVEGTANKADDICPRIRAAAAKELPLMLNQTRDSPALHGEADPHYSSFQELLDCWCCDDHELVQCCSLPVGQCEEVAEACDDCFLEDRSTSMATALVQRSEGTSSASLARSRTTSSTLSSLDSTHSGLDSFDEISTWPRTSTSTDEQQQQQRSFRLPCEKEHNRIALEANQSPEMTLQSTAQSFGSSSVHSRSPQHICHWAGCGIRCASIAHLAQHVNKVHIGGVTANGVQHLGSETRGQPDLTSSWDHDQYIRCLWDSCQAQYLTPETAWDDSEVILQHILSAHVGHDSISSESTSKVVGRDVTKRKRDPIVEVADLKSGHISSPSRWLPELLAQDCGCVDGDRGEHACGWSDCSQTFTSHEALTEHISTEHVGSGKAEYECCWRGCTRGNRVFQQKQKILRHLQTHTGHRPFVCQICRRRFSEANTLAQHIRTHTNERPYACDFPGCGKSFAVAGSLTIHKRIHTGEKPFKCSWPGCQRAFGESSNLTKHMRLHTGERPFSCPVAGCNKTFSRPDQAARHRKTHERKL